MPSVNHARGARIARACVHARARNCAPAHREWSECGSSEAGIATARRDPGRSLVRFPLLGEPCSSADERVLCADLRARW